MLSFRLRLDTSVQFRGIVSLGIQQRLTALKSKTTDSCKIDLVKKFIKQLTIWKDRGGVLPQILDRGVPRSFLNPNPI